MSYAVAPWRSATAVTWSAGTYRNSASGSTNRLMSHGHAIRSTFGRSRVTHFISSLFLQPMLQLLASTVTWDTLRVDERRAGVDCAGLAAPVGIQHAAGHDLAQSAAPWCRAPDARGGHLALSRG